MNVADLTCCVRYYIGVLCLLLAAGAAWAQPGEDALLVRARSAEGPQVTPYLRAQVDRAWAQDARRQARLDAVATEGELLAVQAEIRRAMLDAIGGLPDERTPLDARVVGTERLDGYSLERIVFESVPGIHVTAVVYVPERADGAPRQRRPAVLLAAGHATNGKAYENYQRIGGRLARLGYVVISWDPIGQGERSQFWDAARGDTRYDRVCGEHAVLGNLATLAGANVARWMVWDGMRALDYLLTRDDVDPDRIAITGTSGGGFQSAWIGALDPRIAVVAPSAFITSLPMRMANRIFEDPDSDPEQDPPGLVAAGIDHVGLLLAAYPRHLHVSAVARDFFPIEGTRLTLRRVQAIYARFGHADRVRLSEAYARHSYPDSSQLSTYRFMARVFGMEPPTTLPETQPLPDDRLRVTATGQVRVDLPGRSLTDVIREYHHSHRGSRETDLSTFSRRWFEASPLPIRTVEPERGQPGTDAVAWTRAGSTTWRDVTIDRYLLRYADTQEVPLLHIHRGGSARRPTVLHVDLRGKVTAERWPEIARALAAGSDVLSFDLPGTGETRMPYDVATHPYIEALKGDQRHDHQLASVMANHVYNGLLTGRPYLVDAIEAVAVVRDFAAHHLRPTTVSVTATGSSALLAAAAAAVVPDLALDLPADAALFDAGHAVTTAREVWPIQYLIPGGAYVRLR